MLNFWHKGFYFNNYFFEYLNNRLFVMVTPFGLNYKFINLIFLRTEGFYLKIQYDIDGRTVEKTTYLNKFSNKRNFFQLNLDISKIDPYYSFIFNNYLFLTYPLFKNLKTQYNTNLIFFFLIKSYKGISLKIGRFLFRKTRAKTYLHFKKSIKLKFN